MSAEILIGMGIGLIIGFAIIWRLENRCKKTSKGANYLGFGAFLKDCGNNSKACGKKLWGMRYHLMSPNFFYIPAIAMFLISMGLGGVLVLIIGGWILLVCGWVWFGYVSWRQKKIRDSGGIKP